MMKCSGLTAVKLNRNCGQLVDGFDPVTFNVFPRPAVVPQTVAKIKISKDVS